jgi:hypothetical protein
LRRIENIGEGEIVEEFREAEMQRKEEETSRKEDLRLQE